MSEQTNQKKGIREFGLSSLAVDNSTSIFILTFMIFLGGIMSYTTMPKESFPEIVIPTIYVGTTYPGNSPVDMENLITRPIEKEIKTITGIKKVTSTSVQDYSTVIVEFNTDVDVDKALREVKDAVDKSKSDLPTDLDQEPNVFELDFSEFPIMNINMSGDFPMEELKEYAEYLEDEIEALSEISEVEIKGALDREVRIDVDVFKMSALQISFGDIENAIAAENVTISGGDMLTRGHRRSIRVVGEFENMDDIRNVIVKHEDAKTVFLKDIADIQFDFEERQSYARSSSLPVISLDVKKRSGENLINAADKISDILAKAKEKKLPEGISITVTNDQSKMTRKNVDNLENSIISGVILVVLVLLFFLGLRNASFVGIAIPMSMFMSFILLSLFGVSLNMMVLFGLILALGMLVDNGIVVVENIYRLMQEGKSAVEAAKQGVGEVAVPIITSTATTLAAFFPLLFWDDMMGEFMKYLPITLIVSLGSSLFVALVINPVLTANYMKLQDSGKKIRLKPLFITLFIMAVFMLLFFAAGFSAGGNLMLVAIVVTLINVYLLRPASFRFQDHVLPRLESAYSRLITFALRGRKPWYFLGGTFGLLIVSLIFLGARAPQVFFFPVNDPQYINIYIELPLGTDIESTNRLTKQVEQQVFDAVEPYKEIVEAVIANVGEGTTDPAEGQNPGITPHRARITVSFIDFEYRGGVNTRMVMEKIREGIHGFPDAKITVDKNHMGPPVGKPINIEVSGEDYDKLIHVAEGLKKYIASYNIPGIEELKTDLERGKPELIVHVDRAAARRYGLSTATIATSIRTALFGKEVSKYKLREDDYPIMLRFEREERYNLENLLNQKISFRDQATGKMASVPISAVTTIEYSSSYGSVKRKNLDRVITVFSNVKDGYNPTEINDRIKQLMRGYTIPAGYTVKFTGEQEEQAKTMNFLMVAFTVAVFLIFLIIVAQFNSIVSPLIIILSVLFSTIGVFLGLAIFKMDVIILMTGIGIISLAGVVVNNAIVLMDYINLLRKRKREELGLVGKRLPIEEITRSIIEGGKTRLRPVLLTAITTVLGLIPLAIGLNINFWTLLDHWDPEIYIGGDNVVFWGPMAWTVIFGLTFATFLTLVIVPVMYLLADKIAYRFQRLMGKEV